MRPRGAARLWCLLLVIQAAGCSTVGTEGGNNPSRSDGSDSTNGQDDASDPPNDAADGASDPTSGPAVPAFLLGADIAICANEPTAFVSADLNGDDSPDLVVRCSGTEVNNHVSVLLNNGDGTFAAPVAYAVDGEGSSIAVGDLNGDSLPDLAVATMRSADDAYLAILLNDGDGTFGAPLLVGRRRQVSSVTIGDLNGDLHGDLVVTFSTGAERGVYFLPGQGDGTFAEETPVYLQEGAQHPRIGDWDGDGHPDLLFNELGDDCCRLLGLFSAGDGTFGDAIELGRGVLREVADLDGDGVADLVVHLEAEGVLQILLNRGAATFAAMPIVSMEMPLEVAAADLDGDGVLDLAVTERVGGGGFVQVLINDGAGAFAEPAVAYEVDSGVGPSPLHLLAGDWNADGDVDLATVRFSGNLVTLANQIVP